MKIWRKVTVAAVLAMPLMAITSSTGSAALLAPTAHETAPTARAAVETFADKTGDVANRKLDIRKVTVRNAADAVTVRIYYPGVRKVYGYPLGYVNVYLDTDREHSGPEYGHFMQFWSDYRFAETEGWREHPTPEWGHSPEGECVSDAGLRSDPALKLRWFEYRVLKRDGCFEADAVRVAVTTVNQGENHPYREWDHPYRDHLGAKHAWTPWVAETA